jgi:hypothetical protein
VKEFAGYGTTYDLKSFSKYYDDNVGKVAAKTIDNIAVEGHTIYLNGKEVKSLNAEVISNLVMKNGIATVGTATPGTDEDVTHASPDKTNNNERGIGEHIHIHPYRNDVINLVHMGGWNDFKIEVGPSPADYSGAPNPEWTTRNVVVDSKSIYLINSNSTQTIQIKKSIE